jgi:hypothetical protein
MITPSSRLSQSATSKPSTRSHASPPRLAGLTMKQKKIYDSAPEAFPPVGHTGGPNRVIPFRYPSPCCRPVTYIHYVVAIHLVLCKMKEASTFDSEPHLSTT